MAAVTICSDCPSKAGDLAWNNSFFSSDTLVLTLSAYKSFPYCTAWWSSFLFARWNCWIKPVRSITFTQLCPTELQLSVQTLLQEIPPNLYLSIRSFCIFLLRTMFLSYRGVSFIMWLFCLIHFCDYLLFVYLCHFSEAPLEQGSCLPLQTMVSQEPDMVLARQYI